MNDSDGYGCYDIYGDRHDNRCSDEVYAERIKTDYLRTVLKRVRSERTTAEKNLKSAKFQIAALLKLAELKKLRIDSLEDTVEQLEICLADASVEPDVTVEIILKY